MQHFHVARAWCECTDRIHDTPRDASRLEEFVVVRELIFLCLCVIAATPVSLVTEICPVSSPGAMTTPSTVSLSVQSFSPHVLLPAPRFSTSWSLRPSGPSGGVGILMFLTLLLVAGVFNGQRSPRQDFRDDEVERVIDEIYREYVMGIAESRSNELGAVYARYSTRFQNSLGDQVREVLKWASDHGICVPRVHIYYDRAVSGKKSSRLGLEALKATLSARQVSCLLLFATNRLFRQSAAQQLFIDQVTREWRQRCVFVRQNFDTGQYGSELMVQLFGMMDQFQTRANVDHIRAAHIGLMREWLVTGTMTFGYSGEPIPGRFTRRGLPTCRFVICTRASKIVLQIFNWFGRDGLSIPEIVRRLKAMPEAPLPVKAVAGWTSEVIRKMLRNKRYRGDWSYGETEAQFLVSKDYTRQQSRETPLWRSSNEELRIIPDDLWCLVEQRLAKHAVPEGRPKKFDDRDHPRPRLLEGLFYCPTHNRPLTVSGAHGKFLTCPICQRSLAEERPLFSLLDRRLAEEKVFETLLDRIVGDPKLIDDLVEQVHAIAREAVQPDATRVADLEHSVKVLRNRIDFNRRTVGETPAEQEETRRLIQELSRQRRAAEAELASIRLAATQQPQQLSREEIVQRLDEVRTVLQRNRSELSDEQLIQLRRIAELLTGGRINLVQRGERVEKKGWLEGSFSLRLLQGLQGQSLASSVENPIDPIVTIVFRKVESWKKRASEAKALLENGMSPFDVAKRMTLTVRAVSRLVKRWFTDQGLSVPPQFQHLSLKPSEDQRVLIHCRIADEVERLLAAGWKYQDIAEHCKVNRDEITRAVEYLAKRRGEKPVDGRSRRKQLRLQREQQKHSDDPLPKSE
jgi:site-specific DNA recombinase